MLTVSNITGIGMATGRITCRTLAVGNVDKHSGDGVAGAEEKRRGGRGLSTCPRGLAELVLDMVLTGGGKEHGKD